MGGEQASAYYRQPGVRARIWEYCGGRGKQAATCEYLAGYPRAQGAARMIAPRERLDERLEAGVDISRSAWDQSSLLFCLDLDYVNFDHRGEAYVAPARVFGLLEPVYQAVRQVLGLKRIEHLAVMTGKGYHFAWRVRLEDPVVSRLAARGRLPESMLAKYRHDRVCSRRLVAERAGQAEHGAGMVMEYLCHRVLEEVRGELPVVGNGVTVLPGERGREAASLDLSGYGDPLYLRNFRCVFSSYQKQHAERAWVGDGIADGTPTQYCLPRSGHSLDHLLAARRDPQAAGELARAGSGEIPEAGAGMERALAAYLGSRLRAFHDQFYDAQPDLPERWPEGYGRVELGALPACAAEPLARPNDLLLDPTNLQTVSRVLGARGWHPRHIAGLVRSRYESDYGWGWAWAEADAAYRAEAYVRLLQGLAAAGLDRPEEVGCAAQQQRGACPRPWCGHDLARYRRATYRAGR